MAGSEGVRGTRWRGGRKLEPETGGRRVRRLEGGAHAADQDGEEFFIGAGSGGRAGGWREQVAMLR